MSTTTAPERLLTAEEFLALPDDGKERWLIEGKVYPREPGMSVRNKKHGRVSANVAFELRLWNDARPAPRGCVVSGDTGFKLSGTPDSLVGVDVAYVSAEMDAADDAGQAYYDGPPVLAVEVLSPSDKHEEVVRKVGVYIQAGCIVWLLDPDFRTLAVHRPGEEPVTYNTREELSGEPYLPGFRVAVAQFFDP